MKMKLVFVVAALALGACEKGQSGGTEIPPTEILVESDAVALTEVEMEELTASGLSYCDATVKTVSKKGPTEPGFACTQAECEANYKVGDTGSFRCDPECPLKSGVTYLRPCTVAGTTYGRACKVTYDPVTSCKAP